MSFGGMMGSVLGVVTPQINSNILTGGFHGLAQLGSLGSSAADALSGAANFGGMSSVMGGITQAMNAAQELANGTKKAAGAAKQAMGQVDQKLGNLQSQMPGDLGQVAQMASNALGGGDASTPQVSAVMNQGLGMLTGGLA